MECGAWPPDLRVARSACLLHPPADVLVHQLKYRGWRALATPMAERMASLRFPPDVEAEARFCVPVPTTATRRRERGYHQAEAIAVEFARLTGRTLLHALERTDDSASQTSLQPLARRANVAGAFSARRDCVGAVRHAHLLLVDDVLTTGATAIECAATLVAAGARCISLITFARALDARRLTQT
jgi:ComF family protein